MGASDAVAVEVRGAVAWITLIRPDAHNAFDEEIIRLLKDAFAQLAKGSAVRAIVLTGSGKSFCAGADLNWMKRAAQFTREQNVADARAMAEMFAALRACPKPVIARVNGAAFGGGAGLVAASDISVASDDAVFAFSEVKLGLIPAVISPYVIERIGPAAARRLFMTGERFGTKLALELGLVDIVAPKDKLDDTVGEVLSQLASSGPVAMGEAKRLVTKLAPVPKDISDCTIEAIADIRRSPEGKEGVAAFLEKRKPSWRKD